MSTFATPTQPLSDIIDLPKLLPQTADAIATIWNGYHQLQGPGSKTISAVIPYEIYKKMADTAEKYRQFVVPLPREVLDDSNEKKMGAELHYLVSAHKLIDQCNTPTVADLHADQLSACCFPPCRTYSNGPSCQQTLPTPMSHLFRQFSIRH